MANKRISARRGQVVNLDVSFYHNGVLTDPYAIRSVDIYQTSVVPHNLVATIPFVDPTDSLYPLPSVRTDVGKYYLPYDFPIELEVPNVFFDVWNYFATNPCDSNGTGTGTGTNPCDLNDPLLVAQLLNCCHRFWGYPDGWICSDDLSTINFGFEPLNIHFNKSEIKPLEVSLMPLPLYDYDYNLIAPIIPFLEATISVETRNHELLVDAEPMTIGLRQGSYRSNPYVLKWIFDTSRLLIGTYQYRVKIVLPDGTTRVSSWFIFTVT